MVSEETDRQIEEDWNRVYGNLVYQNDHQWIVPVITTENEENSCISVYGSFLLPEDLWGISHSFYTNTDTMVYKDEQIYLNGIPMDKTYVPAEAETDFSYKRNQLQRFSRDLTSENHKLLAAVIIVALLFIIFIIVARRNNRSRFFYEDEEDMDEYWENKR